MVYTEHARRYLLNEGLPGDQIIKTGSPQKEVLDYHRKSIDASDVLSRFGLSKKKYFTVSIHREENVDDPTHLKQLVLALNSIAGTYNYPLIFSCHPRTRNRLDEADLKIDNRVRAMPPLGFFDFVSLQKHAYCTVSDSGTITEESSILGYPAVTVRQAHERPEGMDEGTVIMAGLNSKRILDSIELAVRQEKSFGISRIVEDYNVDQVSWKVSKIIFSYTDFIKRKTWHMDVL
jgi:UDP-N-acetylglucosamine 2-epimerase (non-hydrolysing)